jgi:surface protein
MRLCACVSSSTAFNQHIGGWNVARVANLYGMLHGAAGFDQNLGSWNVASVANLAAALDFASGLSFGNKRAMYMGWGSTVRTWYPTWGLVDSNIASAVTWWVSAPRTAMAASGPIGSWDTSAVTNFGSLFSSKPSFNDDISSWNVASATRMDRMFFLASAFNQNIGSWNVGRVNSVAQMFYGASAFNQNIGSWDVARVTTMAQIFYSSAFNHNIGGWNVAQLTSLSSVFSESKAFNQDIGGWNVASATTLASKRARAHTHTVLPSLLCVHRLPPHRMHTGTYLQSQSACVCRYVRKGTRVQPRYRTLERRLGTKLQLDVFLGRRHVQSQHWRLECVECDRLAPHVLVGGEMGVLGILVHCCLLFKLADVLGAVLADFGYYNVGRILHCRPSVQENRLWQR